MGAFRAKVGRGKGVFRLVERGQVLAVGKIGSPNVAVAGRRREDHGMESSAQGQTKESAHRQTNDNRRLQMRDSGGQALRIKLSASKPCKMRLLQRRVLRANRTRL